MRAAKRHGLSVMRVRERELDAAAASQFRIPAGALQASVNEAGKPLGPPWTADQKLAALVAWLVLAGSNV